MLTNKTVVISSAGRGMRLGANMPKSLLDICGKPLIYYQLEALKDVKDVRIIVGFQAEKVIQTVKDFREDVTFLFNNNYLNTGTGASFSLGAKDAKKFVISLDGDLIVHPEDFRKVLESDIELIGAGKPMTENPVYINTKVINNLEYVESFSRINGKYEWTGLALLETERLTYGDKHVYQIIEPLLPVRAAIIRTREIDTPLDYEKAIKWVRNKFEED